MQDAPPEPKQEGRTQFIRRMYSTNRASYGDTVRLVHALATGKPSDAPHAELLKALQEKGIARADWELKEGDKVTKGVLAYLLVKTLGISGGLTMTILGVSQRYALREMDYHQIIIGRYTEEYVTGREILDVMTRAEMFKKEGSLDSIRK